MERFGVVLAMLGTEALQCCKLGLMGVSGPSSGVRNADRHADGKNQAKKISAGNKDSTDSWTQNYLCDPLAGNLAVFYESPKTLWETNQECRPE